MKKGIMCAVVLVLGLTLAACSGTSDETSGSETESQTSTSTVTINQSPDKYTWYVNNYIGMNAASVGYEAIDGFRHDAYGAGTLKVIYVAADGTYIDPKNEEQLKEYVVVAQSYVPNTEIKYTFQVDSEGEEYDNLVGSQNIQEIVLAVAKVGEAADAPTLTQINPAPDKYTQYVRDYVGRNLAECGYYSLSGNLTDAYGSGYIFFDIVADDGSYVDPGDIAALAGYMVTAQSVTPNTEIGLTFMTNSEGEEYSNLVDGQTLERITLNVTRAPDSGYPVGEEATPVPEATEPDAGGIEGGSSSGSGSGAVSSDFRETMDAYEAFMNEYVDFMVTYSESDDTLGMLADYTDMLSRYGDWADELDAIDEDSLSAADWAYYLEVTARVNQRLLELSE